MSSHISKSVRSRWYVPSIIALAMTAFTIAALAIYAVPSAHAAPPPGDCWGGALSDDPLHCHVLEEAQRDGIIEVEAVYEGGGVLYVYLAQSDRVFMQSDRVFMQGVEWTAVRDEVYLYIKEQAEKEANRTGKYECVLDIGGCSAGTLGNHGLLHSYILPPLKEHEDIMLRQGGVDAVRSEPGWAAFRQLWPAASAGAAGTGGAAGAGGPAGSGGFDFSDVDLVNLPEIDCAHPHSRKGRGVCTKRAFFRALNIEQTSPLFGIAGWNSIRGGKTYIQLKATSYDDPRIQGAREELSWIYSKLNDDNMALIPVKYDYEELWRWSMMLDRVASSGGNAVGITGSWVGTNLGPHMPGDTVVYPLDDLKEAPYDYDLGASYKDMASIRETVLVEVLDARRAVKALPELLRQLSIPADAVGVILQRNRTPPGTVSFGSGVILGGPFKPADHPWERLADSSDDAEWEEVSNWMLAGASAGLLLLLATLGSVIFIGVRRLARRRT